ncbi:MAG: hypothetical protein QXL27_02330 [Candidatus Bathyarchaeia archaeon]
MTYINKAERAMGEEDETIKAYISLLKKNLNELVERYNKAKEEMKRLEEELKQHKILIDWMDKSIKMFERAKNMDELNRLIDKSLKELEKKHPEVVEKLKQIKPPTGKDTMVV